MEHKMTVNPAVATVAGVVLIATTVAAIYALLYVLEAGVGALGKDFQYLLWMPLVLFGAYLIGNAWLENRARR